jgi:anti-anti-sigma factor
MTTNASERERLRAAQLRNMGDLMLRSERDGDVHTIRLFGELDLASAAEVEDELKALEATDAAAIIVDLAGLTFIDSTGIRLLIAAEVRSRADSNRLRVLRGPASVQRVFEICAVDGFLPFAD